ncbi:MULTISPECIES: hypothetical protein [Legionella]|uniref:hypothetical protein n=1 Tax=Legionella TaxID=445 RepID=UPI000962D116|nr:MULTISPECIES: hypothetical protein [Legionella]MBN9226351.1 hypothetical protein [Legionella steelei]OJW12090.1 MAG: hypothetical protein BGO44_03395 [Legionella sp. 39-23]
MFARLRSIIHGVTNTSSSNSALDVESSPVNLKATAPSKESEPSDTPKNTWVFIWDMTAEKVGHAAIQTGGSRPKKKAKDPGLYISIHPYGVPSTGLTSILPLPAHLATNLSEDMETLGASENTGAFDMDQPLVKPNHDAKPLPPDHIYHFKNLNTHMMSQHIQEIQKKVETGEVGYQLFPNVNLLGFFRDSSAFVSQDPIDVEMHRRASKKRTNSNQVYNCTTLVSDVLNQGGLPISRSLIKPWGITPNGLSSEIKDSEEISSQGPQI